MSSGKIVSLPGAKCLSTGTADGCPPKNIINFTKRLGLNWHRRILLNYLEIFDLLKRKLNLKFTDVTFDHFEHIVVKLDDYLDLIEAEASE